MPEPARGRLVFGTNVAVTAVLLIGLAGIALVVRPPAPPGISEFAPQASKPITKAPRGQSAAHGAGPSTCPPGAACIAPRPTPSATPRSALASPRLGLPSALQCYTWPDGTVTQTFDPQSPPCIATWPEQARGNGGGTTRGVTAHEIRVALPIPSTGSESAGLKPLVDFFNSHYQLYGRKIVLVPVKSATLDNTNVVNPSAQHADGEAIAALDVFAATDFLDTDPNVITLPGYSRALADHHVVSLLGGHAAPDISDQSLLALAPYAWSYHLTFRATFLALAGLVCHELKGQPARHSSSYASTTRSFAVVLPDEGKTGGRLDGLDAMRSELSRCGVSLPPVVYYDPDDPSGSALSSSMLQLKSAGVTSLIWMPWIAETQASPQQVAQRIGYQPEWVTLGWQKWLTGAQVLVPSQGLSSTFGVGNWSKGGPTSSLPWFQAYASTGASPRSVTVHAAEAVYNELLLLAAGVQMAGPHLTPQTFAAALRSTQFGNPGAGTAPSWQPGVSFDADSVTMTHDVAGFWYDTSYTAADATNDAPSQNPWTAFCYVGLGARFSDDSWPRADRFYSGHCR